MKKSDISFMKVLVIFIITILCCICTKIDAQLLSVNIGDSQTKGLAGIELTYENISIAGGWRPMKLGFPDRWRHAYSGSLTLFQKVDKDFYYFQVGMSTGGMVALNNEGNYEPEPSVIALIGLRYFPYKKYPKITNRLSINVGAGVNASQSHVNVAIEFLINFVIIR